MDAVAAKEEREVSQMNPGSLLKTERVNWNLTGKSDCWPTSQVQNLIMQEMFQMLS